MEKDFFDKIFSNLFPIFGHLELKSVKFLGAQTQLEVILRFDNDEENPEFWQINCINTISYKINTFDMSSLTQYDNHPIFLPYQEPIIQLVYKGKITDPYAAWVALYNKHKSLVSNWIPFEMYFYKPNKAKLEEILSSQPKEIFAAGPETLIKAYGEVLESYGVTVEYSVYEKLILYNKKRQEMAKNSSALVWSNSYVIAKKFQFILNQS